MGFRFVLPKGKKKTAPLLVVVATGVAVSLLARSGPGTARTADPTSRPARVAAAWHGVTTALDAYQTFARSSAQDRPAGDAGLAVVRASAERSRGYLDAVDSARRAWDAVTVAGLPGKASDGLPAAATAREAGGAVAGWVDAQRTQSLLVTTCLGASRTLVAAQVCFRERVDAATQQSWLAAASRVGQARESLEKQLGG